MSDFTKCKDENCKQKEFCKRYTSPESERQSYFVNSPRDEKGKCDMFWGTPQELIFEQLLKITK